MLFGIRFDLRNPAFAGVDLADRYRAALDMAEWADRNGGLYVAISEHHGSDDGYLPSPLVMAAAIAARTSTIHIMVAAIIAPLYDPLRLAEDIAVVDQLSGGRLGLTFAIGYVPAELAMFGVDPSERVARLRETVSTLRAAWTGEPFEFRGRTVQVRPTPAQPGGPGIMIGGSSEGAARRAARIGDGFVPTDSRFWDFYRDECLQLGKPDPGDGMAFDTKVVVLAEDPEAAWHEIGAYFLHETNAYGAWQAAADVDTPYREVAGIDALRAEGMYRILTPAEYAAEVEASSDELTIARLHPMVGGIPPDLAWDHLRLFEKHFV